MSPLPGLPQRLVFSFLSTVDADSQKGFETAPSRLSQACPTEHPRLPPSHRCLPCSSKELRHAHSHQPPETGNPQATFNIQPSHPSLQKSPRGHTGVIAFPTWPLGTAEHACLSAEQKGQLQSHGSSPSSLQQAQRMDQPSSSPLRHRGRVLRGEANPWHPRSLSIAQSTRKASHPPQPYGTAQPRGAQYPHSGITSGLCPC